MPTAFDEWWAAQHKPTRFGDMEEAVARSAWAAATERAARLAPAVTHAAMLLARLKRSPGLDERDRRACAEHLAELEAAEAILAAIRAGGPRA